MDTATAGISKSFRADGPQKVIHAYASMPHYYRHIDAVFKHLHPSIKGNFFAAETKIKNLPEGVFLVASFKDVELLSKRSVIYLEHGAGQSYRGDEKSKQSPFYHGSNHPPNVIGYVSPSDAVAKSWPKPSIAVGCPALDVWHTCLQEMHTQSLKPAITFTFHWDCKVAPESRWALPHYAEKIPQIVDHLQKLGFDVFGHAHPRAEKILKRFWEKNGIEYLDSPDMVFWSSDILIADNTSLLLEFASLNKPVVFLNAPWYRKHINHGGRFWDWTSIGLSVDNPEDLLHIDFDSYLHQDPYALERQRVVQNVYKYLDGSAGTRAAQWVTEQVLKV